MPALLWLAALVPVLHAGEAEPIPPLSEPVSAQSAVLAQLRADLSALQAPAGVPELPPSFAASPAAFASLQKSIEAASRPKTAPAQTDALRRIEVANQLLARVDPNEFAKLPQAKQDAALASLWDGWRDRGLVPDPSARADPGGALDRLIVAGVEDRALTSMNKSAFLGVGVLGYPVEDALWLQRTRIDDALEENNLKYPRDQRWENESHTPEFLGTTKEAQSLVDAWGAATESAKRLVAEVEAGEKVPATPFSRLVQRLWKAKDERALAYLSGEDPTFTAFLMDVRKPGYFLYNGDRAVIDRILDAAALAALGIRRVDKGDGNVQASTYFYRPERVARRLLEAAEQKGQPDDQDVRRRLGEYGARAETLARALR